MNYPILATSAKGNVILTGSVTLSTVSLLRIGLPLSKQLDCVSIASDNTQLLSAEAFATVAIVGEDIILCCVFRPVVNLCVRTTSPTTESIQRLLP